MRKRWFVNSLELINRVIILQIFHHILNKYTGQMKSAANFCSAFTTMKCNTPYSVLLRLIRTCVRFWFWGHFNGGSFGGGCTLMRGIYSFHFFVLTILIIK